MRRRSSRQPGRGDESARSGAGWRRRPPGARRVGTGARRRRVERQHTSADGGNDGGVQLVVRCVEHLGQDPVVHVFAQDRSRPHQPSGRIVERLDPHREQISERRRDSLMVGDRDQFLGEEGIALGTAMDGVHDRPRWHRPRNVREEQCDGVAVQSTEFDRRDRPEFPEFGRARCGSVRRRRDRLAGRWPPAGPRSCRLRARWSTAPRLPASAQCRSSTTSTTGRPEASWTTQASTASSSTSRSRRPLALAAAPSPSSRRRT